MKLIRLIASPVLMYILAGLYALILAVGVSHFCGKLLWPCHCPRVFLLCSLVYSVTVIAGS